MRIIITEEQYKRVLNEETRNINSFINDIKSKFDISTELEEGIIKFINDSNCQNIEFAGFNISASGVALHDGVLINKYILNNNLNFLLFIIFHEVAHQYQFKKYGENKMYECYIGKMSDEEGAIFMKNTEMVADEFAGRKIREFQKKGLINSSYVPPQMYKNVPIMQITMLIKNYRSQMRLKNIDSPEKISEYFYNVIKSRIE